MTYSLQIKGVEALRDIEDLTPQMETALSRAVNKTADRTRTDSARRMRQQLNFPPSYLQPGAKRLYVSRYAKPGIPEAHITARWRPTSLARFANSTTVQRGRPVRVTIKPGKQETVTGAFLVRLRAGTADLETKSNLGLAVRLEPGERLRSPTKRFAVPFSKSSPGLFLLYGPSVAQAFAGRDVGSGGPGVRDEVAPSALSFLENEFLRLMRI